MTPIPITTRAWVKKDLGYLRQLDEACSGQDAAWSEDQWWDFFNSPIARGIVAEQYHPPHRVLGYAAFEDHNDDLRIVNMGVAPPKQRQQIGTRLIDKLKRLMSSQARKNLFISIIETNMPAALFFKAQGFRSNVLRRHFGDRDGYAFVYPYRPPQAKSA